MQNVKENDNFEETERRNLKPSDLTQDQDMLLLAGSKVSYREIYTREMDLPTKYGKYYKASDVDDLFILINGMLTDISQQTYRQNKALTEARQDAKRLETENEQLKSQNENLNKQVHDLTNQVAINDVAHHNDELMQNSQEVDQLKTDLANKEAAYNRLAQTAAAKLQSQQASNQALMKQIVSLRQINQDLMNKLNNALTSQTDLAK